MLLMTIDSILRKARLPLNEERIKFLIIGNVVQYKLPYFHNLLPYHTNQYQ